MIFHNTNYPDSLIGLEKRHWGPFIQTAMDNGHAPARAWGNALILSPTGENLKFNTVSYDLYKTLKRIVSQLESQYRISIGGTKQNSKY